MLYIVYLFYIWFDSIVEVGFDVCDMYVWVGILLMCLSFCSFKKKSMEYLKIQVVGCVVYLF